MLEFKFDMAQTIAFAVILLIIGREIKKRVSVLERFFIPAPVIGGTLFSLILLWGHQTETFSFSFNGDIRSLLMLAFFTTIGFSASIALLKKGGVGVLIFLIAATVLVIIQDAVGVALAKAFNLHPLIGLAAGSIPLTGGHGTSGAFGPYLEELGASGALVVALASATYGLVAGCLIGGPVAKRLMAKHNLKPNLVNKGENLNADIAGSDAPVTEARIFQAVVLISIAMGIGSYLNPYLKEMGITLPAYISSMIIAAIIRNIYDAGKKELPFNEIGIVGNICLSLFLSMALMSLKLWELADLALPLIAILLIQTAIMAAFAYFVTFNAMGRDYDAAVIAAGHCGFGLGASPNAMANMETFTATNGPSPKAFFVVPIVAALFIDFTNAAVITTFAKFFA